MQNLLGDAQQIDILRPQDVLCDSTIKLRWPILGSRTIQPCQNVTDLFPLQVIAASKRTPRKTMKAAPEFDSIASLAVKSAKKQQDALHLQELKSFRNRTFSNPKRSFSKVESDNFCIQLLGTKEASRIKSICIRTADDRSHADCLFLGNACRKAVVIALKTTLEQRCMILRVANIVQISQGKLYQYDREDSVGHTSNFELASSWHFPMASSDSRNRLCIVVKGLLSHTVQNNEVAVFKDGDAFIDANSPIEQRETLQQSSEYHALQPTILLVIGMSKILQFVNHCELSDLKGALWMLAEKTDGSHPSHWQKYAAWIVGEELHLLNNFSKSSSDSETSRSLNLHWLKRAYPLESRSCDCFTGINILLNGFQADCAFQVVFQETSQRMQQSKNSSPEKQIQTFVSLSQPDREKWLATLNHFGIMASECLQSSHETEPQSDQTHSIDTEWQESTQDVGERPSSSVEQGDEKLDIFFNETRKLIEKTRTCRNAYISVYLGCTELFRNWSWRELMLISPAIQTLSLGKGQCLFECNKDVEGLYVLNSGSVSLIDISHEEETEFRFPGRDDLVLEEDLEFKRQNVSRKICIGTCSAPATFGEELCHPSGCTHRFTARVDSTNVIAFVLPKQVWMERLDEKKSASMQRTQDLLIEQSLARRRWIEKRIRKFVITRLLVDISKHRHLAERAYANAAENIEKLMKLEGAYAGDDPQSIALITNYDVEAGELHARKACECLEALSRGAQTPVQINDLKKGILKLKGAIQAMIEHLSAAFSAQVQKANVSSQS